MDPACTEADGFALAGRSMVLSFEPDAERECPPCHLMNDTASFTLYFENFFGFCVTSVAIVTFGRVALPDITGPCPVKMDSHCSDSTIPAALRRQLAANAHETVLTASPEPSGMRVEIGRLNMPRPRRAPEFPPRDHPAIRRGTAVRR